MKLASFCTPDYLQMFDYITLPCELSSMYVAYMFKLMLYVAALC